MKLGTTTFLLLIAAAFAAPVAAQQQGGVQVEIETYNLDNGLRVILSPDRLAAVVAVDVWYDVGARDERPGLTGFAHLFEHMMFQGSANVAKGDHMTLIERAGGSMNGTTSADRTNYFQTLPANRLNLGLWLEADRMRSLDISQENLDNQIEVVKEERRMRVDNQPYSPSVRSAMAEISYHAETCFGYGHDLIGSMTDLESATLDDVRRFFDTWYVPGNATLTVVGDFDPASTRQMIEQYFGGIPAGQAPSAPACTEPFSHLPVRREIRDANANLPAVFFTHGLPATGHRDSYALSLLAAVLSDGESARLHQRLVREEQAALAIVGFPDMRRGPSLYLVGAIANQGVDAARLEALLEEELGRVRSEGVTAAELERARNRYRSQTLQTLQTLGTALGRAEALQHFAHFYGDPTELRRNLDRYMAVTLDDIRRVAAQYLVADNRAVVITLPGSGTEE